jgi:hypothetical protein
MLLSVFTEESYENMGELYADILGRATDMICNPIGNVLDMDSGFYAYEYFKAWLSEAQVRAFLEKKAGKEWWKSQEAMQTVKELWSSGMKLYVDEIVQKLGYPGLRVDELVDSLPKL